MENSLMFGLSFLPERDYVTYGYLLSQISLSVVYRLLSVTFVHPTQRVEIFGNILSHFYPSHRLTSMQNFTEIV